MQLVATRKTEHGPAIVVSYLTREKRAVLDRDGGLIEGSPVCSLLYISSFYIQYSIFLYPPILSFSAFHTLWFCEILQYRSCITIIRCFLIIHCHKIFQFQLRDSFVSALSVRLLGPVDSFRGE